MHLLVAAHSSIVDILNRVVARRSANTVQVGLLLSVDGDFLEDGVARDQTGKAEESCSVLHRGGVQTRNMLRCFSLMAWRCSTNDENSEKALSICSCRHNIHVDSHASLRDS
jgi:hypothetical protein